MAGNNEPLFEQLEPRVLLSGSPIPEADDSAAVNIDVTDESVQEEQEISEILFIDSGVDNFQELIEGLNRNVEVIFIEADENGIDRISDSLEDRRDVSAVHIISHGDAGEIRLGNVELNAESLGDYKSQLSAWSDSLTDNADLLIYGCNIGRDSAFVADIADITKADVAASDDLTGAAQLGGDAELEVETGNVEAEEILAQKSYNKASVILTPSDDDYRTSDPISINQTLNVPDGGTDILDNDTPGSILVGINGTENLSGASVEGASVTLAPDGSFTYDPSTSATLQALDVGDSMDDSFTYSTLDSSVANDGLYNISAFQITNGAGIDGDINDTNEAYRIWQEIDGGAAVPGLINAEGSDYNVVNYETGTESYVLYNGNRNGYTGALAYSTIGGGTVIGGEDFSVRAQTYLHFTVGGTYSISVGSDDGRRIELTGAALTANSDFEGFDAAGDQNDSFSAGDNTIIRVAPTGHAYSTGVFQVSAGDILRFDTLFHERGGGDSFNIAIKNGSDTTHGGTGDGWALLENGAVVGLELSSSITTETATVQVRVNGTNTPPVPFAVNISEDFEGGASGWSNNTTTNATINGTNTDFLGRFGNGEISKTYNLGLPAGAAVNISFDMYEIDSWDNEDFIVNINGVETVRDTYIHSADEGTLISPGIFSGWDDNVHQYSINTTVDGSGNLTLGFESTLNSGLSDESWGIDNLSITTNSNAYIDTIGKNQTLTVDIVDLSTDLDTPKSQISIVNSPVDLTWVASSTDIVLGGAEGAILVVDNKLFIDTNNQFDGLMAGETATLTISYKLNDNEVVNNISSTGTLIITITGETATTATDNTAGVTEDTTLMDTGNLITDDDGNGVDSDDGTTLSIVEVGGITDSNTDVAGTFGTLNWASDGSYTYTLNNGTNGVSSAVQNLSDGETASDTFTYRLYDNEGAVEGDGLFSVSTYQVVNGGGATDHDLNSTSESWAIWQAIDGGATVPGLVSANGRMYNIDAYEVDTENKVLYNGDFDGFTGNLSYASINNDGSGGSGGSVTGGDDFSVRAQAHLYFSNAGTYSISVGSDDGRRIGLTAVSTTGGIFTGFTAAGGQMNGTNLGVDSSVVMHEDPTGHNHTVGVFSVAAGDILALDTSFYERGGGDQFHLSIKDSSDTGHGGTADGWALLEEGVFGISINSTEIFPPDDSAVHNDYADLTVTITGTNDAPTVNTVAAGIAVEDTPFSYTHAQMLTLIGAADIDNPNSDLIVSITNVMNGTVVLTGGAGGSTTTFTFTPDMDFNGDLTFNYQVNDQEAANNNSNIGLATINIAPAAETPILSVQPISTSQNSGPVPLVISAAPGSPTEVLTVYINGFPSGAVLSAGTMNGAGRWVLTQAELSGLTVTFPSDFFGDLSVTVTAVSTEGPLTASASVILKVSIPPYIIPVSSSPNTFKAYEFHSDFNYEIDRIRIIPAALQEILRGNPLSFLNKKSDLHFNLNFLSEDALNIIREIFDSNPEAKEFKNKGDGLNEVSGIDLSTYDISQLTEEEQQFIYPLLIGEEPDGDEEDKEDESSFLIEDAVLQEIQGLEEKKSLTQIELDSLEDTADQIMGSFDCLKV